MVPQRLPKHTSTLPSSCEVPSTKRTSPSVQLAVRSTGGLTAVHVDGSYMLKPVSSKATLQKHLGYFNNIFGLSELHQCDQEMLIGRFS